MATFAMLRLNIGISALNRTTIMMAMATTKVLIDVNNN